ncbi:Hypothetical predicted protein [Podarcis lilfordi]|uniref:Uncharacterized protein n=1 Tax=Podarcis lilfordi TaxID=74358 RepID=A0AA35L2E4_9SAUR|nr:Hypothetical predicted protein [Podarcis lilfordi]
MFTWTVSKTSRPAAEEKSLPRNRDIFSVIVTPDRIPKFCIPSLDVDHFATQPETVGDPQEESLGNRPSGEPAKRPRPIRSKSEMCVRNGGILQQQVCCRRETLCLRDMAVPSEHLERGGYHSDPVTQAAFSLPHLPKITTPYGFLTLGESPNIRRKESLFFEYGPAELRILLSQKKETACLSQHPALPLTVHSQPKSQGKSSSGSPRPVLWDKHCNKEAPSPLCYAPSSERCTNKCKKKRFQLLMKRHLPSIKRLRSNRAPDKRTVIESESSPRGLVS